MLTPNEAAGLPEPTFPGITRGSVTWQCVMQVIRDRDAQWQSRVSQATQAASPKQAELVEELPRKITLAIDRFAVSTSRVRRAELEVAILDAIAPATPQQAEPKQAEPVACERCGESPETHVGTHWCDNQSFAAPQQAVSAQELSDEQIAALHKEHRENGWQDGAGPNEFKEIVRAVLATARAQQAPQTGEQKC